MTNSNMNCEAPRAYARGIPRDASRRGGTSETPRSQGVPSPVARPSAGAIGDTPASHRVSHSPDRAMADSSPALRSGRPAKRGEYIFFLGSHPALSAAELWTVLARYRYAAKIRQVSDNFIILRLNQKLPENFLNRLGGTERVGLVVGRKSSPWAPRELAQLLSSPAAEKMSFGLSVPGGNTRQTQRVGLQVKKHLKKIGVKANFIVPGGKNGRLNAAQVIFNHLTTAPHKEMTRVDCDGQYLWSQTVQIQDIRRYERRDTGRPARDPRAGMLPPKLAQIMLNLALSGNIKMGNPPVVLDPFCGLGTVLQEGYLLGYKMVGSDASERMVDASRKNLNYVIKLAGRGRKEPAQTPAVFKHDVRQPFPQDIADAVDAVVTEPYLGKPLVSPLPRQQADEAINTLTPLYQSFFTNVRPLLKPNARVVFALPAFTSPRSSRHPAFTRFPAGFIDDIRSLGYDYLQLVPEQFKPYFRTTERGTVVYARPDALVGREITLWHTRKREGQPN